LITSKKPEGGGGREKKNRNTKRTGSVFPCLKGKYHQGRNSKLW